MLSHIKILIEKDKRICSMLFSCRYGW